MNRPLMAMVVGLGITIAGCATDVDDPIAPAPTPEAQHAPPDVALATELRNPEALLLSGIAVHRGLESVPAKQTPPLPIPPPEQN